MIKIQEPVSITKQCNTDLSKHYTISVQNKRSGYEARITLEIIGGGKNPRIYAFSSNSKLDAIIKILNKIQERLTEYKNSNFLPKEIALKIYDSLIFSIQELKLTSNMEVMKIINNIFKILVNENSFILKHQENNIIEIPSRYSNYVPNPVINSQNLEEHNNVSIQSGLKKVTSKCFKDVAIEWFKYKLSLTKESIDNPIAIFI